MGQPSLRDLVSHAKSTGLDGDDLEREILKKDKDLENAVRSEFDQFLKARSELAEAERQAEERRLGRLATVLAGLAALGAATAGIVAMWSITGSILDFSNPSSWGDHALPLATLLPGCFTLVVIYRGVAALRERQAALLTVELAIGRRTEARGDALRVLERAIEERALPEALITLINERRTTSWSVAFNFDQAAGLTVPTTEVQEISTAADVRIRTIVADRPTASIGLAGPRGVGKSTLLASLCGGRSGFGEGTPPLGVLVSAPVEYQARDFLLHLFSATCRAVLDDAGIVRGVDQRLTARRRRWLDRQALLLLGLAALAVGASLVVSTVVQPHVSATLLRVVPGTLLVLAGALGVLRLIALPRHARMGDIELEDLPRLAQARLEAIRFQQRHTSGWSGQLGPLSGVTLQRSVSTEFTELPQTLPELAEQYREFLARTTRDRRMIVGIDELDKVQSAEAAARFVDDVKSVFGVSGTVFIVSVSEDALSLFERRGIPFRDAFDSAFDEVVAMEYLNLEETCHLLQRRVVGLPVPFQHLCHALSGGLPRDVLRVAREMRRLAESRHQSVEDTARDLVLVDVVGNARAVRQSLSRRDQSPGQPAFARWLTELIFEHDQAMRAGQIPELPRAFESFEETVYPRLAADLGSGEFLRSAMQLSDLATEVLAFHYYAYTVLELFKAVTTSFTPTERKSSKLSTAVERLASTRQHFAIDPVVAFESATIVRRRLGDDFSALNGIEILESPLFAFDSGGQKPPSSS